MSLLDKLERKFRHFGIPNLMLYIVFLNLFVYLIDMVSGHSFIPLLSLSPRAVMSGQYWRVFTFIFIPPSASPIFIALVLYFYYFIGRTLEQHWGTFKFNVFYLIGVIGTIVACFLTGYSSGSATYINLSMFLAFATLYPNYEILLFFILPIKMKYLGYLNAAFLLFQMITGPLGIKILIIVSLLNYILFFGKDLIRDFTGKQKSAIRKKKYEQHFKVINDVAFHKCTVCGITEKDDPDMQFRYCTKCNGAHEYCMEHINNHTHIE